MTLTICACNTAFSGIDTIAFALSAGKFFRVRASSQYDFFISSEEPVRDRFKKLLATECD